MNTFEVKGGLLEVGAEKHAHRVALRDFFCSIFGSVSRQAGQGRVQRGGGDGGFSLTPLWIELDVDQRDDDAHAAEGQQAEVEITPARKPRKKKGIRYFTPIIRSTIA